MADRCRNYRILVPLIFLLTPLIIKVFLSPAFDSYNVAFFSNFASEANFTSASHNETTEMSLSRVLSQLHVKRETNPTILLTLSTMKLPKFHKDFKNPCWYDQYNGTTTLRCFPYFYIAGFSKCGTTDLFYRLVAHPLIVGGKNKETFYLSRHFFNNPRRHCFSKYHCGSVFFSQKYFQTAAERISMTSDMAVMNSSFIRKGNGNKSWRSQAAFAQTFPRETLEIWKQGRSLNKYSGITVEATATTAYDHSLFGHIAENVDYGYPRNTTADWIRRMYPGTKTIMILRDPVERAFSDYTMRLKGRGTASDFHKRVQKAIPLFEQCFKSGMPQLLCLSSQDRLMKPFHVGFYYYHIKTWFEKLPRNQTLILRYEDYVANVPETLAKVYRFLGLPAISKKGLWFISKLYERLNASPFHSKMLSKTRLLLTKFYEPHNEKLAQLMGDERFQWTKTKA